jgi:hypothetical protein
MRLHYHKKSAFTKGIIVIFVGNPLILSHATRALQRFISLSVYFVINNGV